MFGQANTSNLEILIKVNPELVVVSTYDTAMGSKITETMKMLKRPVPDQPINWFDRPPSFMRLIGLKWVMSRLYLKEYRTDIARKARDFFRMFLGVEVSDAEMRKIVYW